MSEPGGGTAQVWSADTYAANARFVSDLASGVMDWLAPRAGERILDLECGDGVLSAVLTSAGASVVGIDTSGAFVATARARGIDARLMDGAALAFVREFDAVFSNAALHWMLDPGAVVAGVRRALRDSGRFVGEFGGHGNVAAILTALRAVAPRYGIDGALASPWYFPTPDDYAKLLADHGFTVDRCVIVTRPAVLPQSGLWGWLHTFCGPYLASAGEEADNAIRDGEDLLAPSLKDGRGTWTADYVRLRFEAHLI